MAEEQKIVEAEAVVVIEVAASATAGAIMVAAGEIAVEAHQGEPSK
jgi:hypothetical protein